MSMGLKAYQIYCGLTNHFRPGSSYDGWKYGFKTRVTEETFNKKNSKWQFIKIERDFPTDLELIKYMAPAFLKIGYINPTHAGRTLKTQHKLFLEDIDKSKRNFLTTFE